jgi:serine protease Do
VLADGTELPAKVIGRDTRLDVALLAVDGATKVKPLPFGVSGALKVGEWVLALGNPFGGEVTASAGVLSTLGRNIGGDLTRRNDVADYAAFLQSSAAVTALNAGGPLVTMAGEIVGINVAHDARGGPIGFAVPIDRVKDIIPMLEASGVVSRTWLGIYVQPVTPEQAKERGMPDAGGALITDVIVPGPGSKAGLRRGDIIRRFAATAVDSRNLPWIASTTAVGKAIDLEVWRDRGVVQLTLVTEAMPK